MHAASASKNQTLPGSPHLLLHQSSPRPTPLSRFLAIYVGKPCIEDDYVASDIKPQECRLRDITYAAPITVDIEYTRGKEIVVKRGRNGVGAVPIGRMPLMLRCSRWVPGSASSMEPIRMYTAGAGSGQAGQTLNPL